MRKTKTYWQWRAMRNRCNNPRNPRWRRYGGRGIKICPRWDSFDCFLADMGVCPQGLTLERIDNDGDYSPINCMWASYKAQARNRSTTKLEEHEPGQIRWLAQLGERRTSISNFFEISRQTVEKIINGKMYS